MNDTVFNAAEQVKQAGGVASIAARCGGRCGSCTGVRACGRLRAGRGFWRCCNIGYVIVVVGGTVVGVVLVGGAVVDDGVFRDVCDGIPGIVDGGVLGINVGQIDEYRKSGKPNGCRTEPYSY